MSETIRIFVCGVINLFIIIGGHMALINLCYDYSQNTLSTRCNVSAQDLGKLLRTKLGEYSVEKSRYLIKDGARTFTKELQDEARTLAHKIWNDLATSAGEHESVGGVYSVSYNTFREAFDALSDDLDSFSVIDLTGPTPVACRPTMANAYTTGGIVEATRPEPTASTLLDMLIETQTSILDLVRSLRRTI